MCRTAERTEAPCQGQLHFELCTFHPSQTTEQRFFRKIDALLSRGFKIGMVNYVLTSETLPDFERRFFSLAQRGVPLHPNPLWGSRGAYSSEGLRILQEYLPSFDYGYRTGLRSPLRQSCYFPAVAYQMNPWGRLHVGCHRTRAGSFFDDELPPQFPGPVPCPQTTCVCLDMYSFLAGQQRNCTTDPLAMYRDALLELAARRAGENEAERFVGSVAAECASQRLGAAGEMGS